MQQATAWEKALKFLAIRSRTEKEVEEYLRKKRFSDGEIEDTIARLKKSRYIDDRRLAEGFARSRAIHKHMGPIRLKRDLIMRGVDPAVAERAVADIFEEIEADKIVNDAIEKWKRINKGIKDRKDLKRLHDYLFRLGHETSTVMKNLESIEFIDEQ